MFTETEKFYINCPYSEKEACKALGGRWDRNAKKWYVPVGISKSRFTKWIQLRAKYKKSDDNKNMDRRMKAAEMGSLIKPNELAIIIGTSIAQAMDLITDFQGPAAKLIGTTRYWERDQILNWLQAESL